MIFWTSFSKSHNHLKTLKIFIQHPTLFPKQEKMIKPNDLSMINLLDSNNNLIKNSINLSKSNITSTSQHSTSNHDLNHNASTNTNNLCISPLQKHKPYKIGCIETNSKSNSPILSHKNYPNNHNLSSRISSRNSSNGGSRRPSGINIEDAQKLSNYLLVGED